MTRRIKSIHVLIVVALAGLSGAYVQSKRIGAAWFTPSVQAQSKTGFTATKVRRFIKDSTTRQVLRFTDTVSSSGNHLRIVTEGEVERLGGFYSVMRSDGLSAKWYPGLRAVSSGYLTAQMMATDQAGSLTPNTDCTQPAATTFVNQAVKTGEEKLLGLRTVVVKTPGARTITNWYAPSLNCYSLKKVATFEDGAQSIEEVVHLDLTEPPPSIFEPPSDFEELLPSKLNERVAATLGRECPTCLQNAGKADDRAYSMMRRRK